MKNVTKHYSNGEVTIVWKNALCIHSKRCWTGLNAVFNPSERPWIKPENATTGEIIDQVNQCPSGALSYFMNADKDNETEQEETITKETIIEVSANGPLLVYGNINIKDPQGGETRKTKVTALCRCGHSSNKPFCDGSHVKNDFRG